MLPVLPPRAVSAARARGEREGDGPRDAGASAFFFGMVRSPNFPRVSILGERTCRRSGFAHRCKTRAQVSAASARFPRRRRWSGCPAPRPACSRAAWPSLAAGAPGRMRQKYEHLLKRGRIDAAAADAEVASVAVAPVVIVAHGLGSAVSVTGRCSTTYAERSRLRWPLPRSWAPSCPPGESSSWRTGGTGP